MKETQVQDCDIFSNNTIQDNITNNNTDLIKSNWN